ncbi:MAG TPA: c-type cytochrome [bacterium]|nr:c-type cytochrome [bacterium]
MKTLTLLTTALPLFLFAACGGDDPKKTDAPAAQDSPAAKQQSQADSQPAKRKPRKRMRRPKVNYQAIKVLFGAEPPAPKAEVASTPELVALGKALYHSEHLSAKGNLSCASCHDLSNYGVDNKPTSTGSTGEKGERNTPTTYNAARQFKQFWDGRADTVEAQAIMPVLNPIEHGLADEAELVAKIKEQTDLVEGFKKAFPGDADPVTAKNFGVAIGAFERTLVTRSKWDDYLDGNQKALSNEELAGLKVFFDVGCQACHMGRTLGGTMFQKYGLHKPYTGKDTGRHKLDGDEAQKYFFKVPALLNVAETAPYLHDGSIATLEVAVRDMLDKQIAPSIAAKVTDEQVKHLVAFLNALTGELPDEFKK